MTPFQQKVYDAVKKIPRGRVSTYKAIAGIIGRPSSVRAVGNALNKNYFGGVPCHRVICSNGNLGGYNRGVKNKIELLVSEGIDISKKNINLNNYKWKKKKFLK